MKSDVLNTLKIVSFTDEILVDILLRSVKSSYSQNF